VKEREGHWYVCQKCGRFYQVVNGEQIQHDMIDLTSENIPDDNMLHEGNCKGEHLGGLTAREHGVNKKRKIKDVNMGRYSEPKKVNK